MIVAKSVSDKVSGVKLCSTTLQHALGEERQFALVDGLRFPTWARSDRQGQNSVRPSHLFNHPLDQEYLFELPRQRERDAQSLRR